ncbi:MAG TPA: ECF-type sigma factor [Pirellulales bacterium]
MPSQQQFIELGELVRETRDWFHIHHANNGCSLGRALELTKTMLLPWAEQAVIDRLDQDPSEAEDLLSEAAARIVREFDSVTALTGKEFYLLMKTTVERLVCDQQRRRFAFRRRNGGDALSLDGDARAARLAELLVDEQPGPEALAVALELKNNVRRAIRRLPPDERQAARLVMGGTPLAKLIEIFGTSVRAAWRRARPRLCEAFAAERPAASAVL